MCDGRVLRDLSDGRGFYLLTRHDQATRLHIVPHEVFEHNFRICVGYFSPIVDNRTDYCATRHSFRKPFTYIICNACINCDNHSTAHVESTIHFFVPYISIFLNPIKFCNTGSGLLISHPNKSCSLSRLERPPPVT